MPKESKAKVAVAGATGFVGSALVLALAEKFHVIALTREKPPSLSSVADTSAASIEWRTCDLFSLLELEEALQGADYGIYLVHSMSPSSRLTQARFEDLDLLLADNFARAAQKNHLKQILYLGGLIPKDTKLSRHLQSRLEVESALASSGVALTSIRCGLIVGPGGSSLKILVNLVRRLPVMILPKWTASKTQPIAREDVICAFKRVIGDSHFYGKSLDLGVPEVMTYRQMLTQTAEVLGVKRPMLPVPVFSHALSLAWVSLFSSSSPQLVGPLVESLEHSMVAEDNPLQRELAPQFKSFADSLRDALLREQSSLKVHQPEISREQRQSSIRTQSMVRSIQRLPLPLGKSASWVADEYVRWLPSVLRPIIQCDADEHRTLKFSLISRKWNLLELRFAPSRSAPDRQIFYVVGGLLADTKRGRRARLEFREVNGGQEILSAIHNFVPTLPWFVYKWTQALVHLIVMKSFGRHLQRCAREQ